MGSSPSKSEISSIAPLGRVMRVGRPRAMARFCALIRRFSDSSRMRIEVAAREAGLERLMPGSERISATVSWPRAVPRARRVRAQR